MSQKFVITQMLVQANWWLLWFIHYSNVYDTDAQIKSAVLKQNTLGGNNNICFLKFSQHCTVETFL